MSRLVKNDLAPGKISEYTKMSRLVKIVSQVSVDHSSYCQILPTQFCQLNFANSASTLFQAGIICRCKISAIIKIGDIIC